MIPVTQSRLHEADPAHPPGNCFAACVASILELPLEAVPDETVVWRPGMGRGKSWALYWDHLLNWLAETRGLGFIEITIDSFWGDWVDTYAIVTGPSPRNAAIQHAVVYFGNEMKHDPHPSRAGLLDGKRTFGFFTAVDPAKLMLTSTP